MILIRKVRRALPLTLVNFAYAAAIKHRILCVWLRHFHTKCVSIARVPVTPHSVLSRSLSNSLYFQVPMFCIPCLATLSILAKWFFCSACYVQKSWGYIKFLPLAHMGLTLEKLLLLHLAFWRVWSSLWRWRFHIQTREIRQDAEVW